MSNQREEREANIRRALDAIEKNGVPFHKAAEQYHVPVGTLHRRFQSGNKNLPTVLTDKEEKQLVEWILEISRRGFPITKEELKDSVQSYLNHIGRNTCFTQNRPGRDWMNRFINNRHKIISERVAESLTRSRAVVTEQAVRDWFSEVIHN